MTVWDVAFYIVIAALIYGLVRPGSPAFEAVKAIASLTEGVVGTATGFAFTV